MFKLTAAAFSSLGWCLGGYQNYCGGSFEGSCGSLCGVEG